MGWGSEVVFQSCLAKHHRLLTFSPSAGTREGATEVSHREGQAQSHVGQSLPGLASHHLSSRRTFQPILPLDDAKFETHFILCQPPSLALGLRQSQRLLELLMGGCPFSSPCDADRHSNKPLLMPLILHLQDYLHP